RLPNGNTFIACRHQLLEVGRDHRVVLVRSWPGYDLDAAFRLPDGRIIALTKQGRCVKLDSRGGVISTFGIDRACQGALDAQVAGQLLIPHPALNKVEEYGPGGELLWTFRCPRPTSAACLANGNMLVTSQESRTVLEVDRDGHAIWEYHLEGV